MAFAVVACSHCHAPWSIDLRHTTVSCPRCRTRVDVARRRRFWEGDDARLAREAAAHTAARMARGAPPEEAVEQWRALRDDRPVPRHDVPEDAAAAQARRHRNLSARADEVALWMTRLVGDTPHERLVAALRRAGLPQVRAEKEIVRMLAGDVVFEPLVGHYRSLEV